LEYKIDQIEIRALITSISRRNFFLHEIITSCYIQ